MGCAKSRSASKVVKYFFVSLDVSDDDKDGAIQLPLDTAGRRDSDAHIGPVH